MSCQLPEAWQLAIDSTQCRSFCVKATTKRDITLEPYQSVVVNGVVKGIDKNISTVVTENSQKNDNYTVCPRVLTLSQSVNNPTIKVNVCNISAKTINLKHGSILCTVQEAKVIDKVPTGLSKGDNSEKVNPIELGVKVDMTLSESELDTVNKLLRKYSHVFSRGPMDLGKTDIVKHSIKLEDENPFKLPYRRIPPGMYDEVREHIKEMLQAGVIRESNSNYSSNVGLVRKIDGSLRFCIDMRVLNSKTRKDCYMLPHFDDVIDTLSDAKYFSKLDLRSGYWPVEIEEEDKHKTAFSVGNFGFYECNRMCFGLTNAPATFQRLMEKCMGELHLRECLIFLDDILIFSKTFKEHCQRLENVFQKLADHGLKLKPSKCELFKQSISYLGHVISEAGISTDPEKVSAVVEWPRPTNIKELRQFLGFIGYYRRFVENFAKIVAPLNNLLRGHETKISKKQKRYGRKNHKPVPWRWTDVEEMAFTIIKEKLTSPPILGFADYSMPFELHTDASSKGLGAVLYQNQGGIKRVIAYASRGLRPSETNYPAHKLEFLALKWAVCDKLHDYLYGNQFEVITDNNPLTYIFTKAKLDATSQR